LDRNTEAYSKKVFGGENMKKKKSILRSLQFLACLLFLMQAYSAYGTEVPPFPVGQQIASFTVGVPGSPEVQKYLGLKSNGPFKLADISAKIVVIEFMNAL
jgi:hypothetical protein